MVLKGANPADVPGRTADQVRALINLKTARVLGLTVLPTLLARVDEPIG